MVSLLGDIATRACDTRFPLPATSVTPTRIRRHVCSTLPCGLGKLPCTLGHAAVLEANIEDDHSEVRFQYSEEAMDLDHQAQLKMIPNSPQALSNGDGQLP